MYVGVVVVGRVTEWGTRCRFVFHQPAPDLMFVYKFMCVCVTPHDVWNIIPILGHTRPYKYLQLNHHTPTSDTHHRLPFRRGGRREIYATAPLDPFNQTLSRRPTRHQLFCTLQTLLSHPSYISPPPRLWIVRGCGNTIICHVRK